MKLTENEAKVLDFMLEAQREAKATEAEGFTEGFTELEKVHRQCVLTPRNADVLHRVVTGYEPLTFPGLFRAFFALAGYEFIENIGDEYWRATGWESSSGRATSNDL